MTVPSHPDLTAGCLGQSGSRLHAVQGGFTLVVTLGLMVLLVILAVGLLSLSAVSLRTSSSAQAQAEARANARLAMMLAIGELQKSIGPDQRITAPSGILDSDPDSAAADGLAYPRLTGVWKARDEATESLDSYNSSPPDYSRDKPNFRRWLVSNAKSEDVEQLGFAQDGAFLNPTNLLGSNDPSLSVKAGKVPVKGGSYAWWVGDENGKAQINLLDGLARETNPAIAELLVGFASPGAHGIKALADYETFDSNSPASDKSITRDTFSIIAPAGTRPGTVVTLWNPYNVDMRINGYNIWLHNLPLSHKFYKNNAPSSIPDFNWHFDGGLSGGTLCMRFAQPYGSPNQPVILKAGEMKIFNHKTTGFSGSFPAANMAENTDPSTFYSYLHAGHPRQIPSGRITGAQETDLISLETKMGTWETVGSTLGAYGWQSTFEVRSEPRGDHTGLDPRIWKQLYGSVYAWRFENSSPSSNQLSKDNFPAKPLRDLVDAPAPFCLIECRLKPLDELQFPNKTWLHNLPAHTYAGCTSSSQGADAKTPFFSHPYTVTFDQRTTVQGLFSTIPYMGPSYTPAGQRFIADREIPQVPLSSLAQLQNLPQHSMESMNWSGHLQQNHAIGNSYASPGVLSHKIKGAGWPFFLTPYINNGGNLSGQTFANPYWTVGVPNTDRSYAANHLLWDDYYFSSMAPQTSTFYQKFGTSRPLKTVVDEFYAGTKALPNPAYVPHFAGKDNKVVSDSLVSTGGAPLPDAHLKSAAHLMVDGGFNINSTSVPAWTILLASPHLKRPVIMDSAGTGTPSAQPKGNFIVSRFAMPIGGNAGQSSTEDTRWRGYRELTVDEIRQLAEAIVRQVKQRGPFRSLGEFINRRLAGDTDDKSLYGALQAALEDPKVDINKDYRDKTITDADLNGTNYAFKRAALGARYQGTPAYISQADILQPIAPIINARSDTFLIRTYGEVLAKNGKTVLAKAWCEAVVQRHPEYLIPQDKPHDTRFRNFLFLYTSTRDHHMAFHGITQRVD